MTALHRQARLHWCWQHVHWNLNMWRNVMFSEEYRFCLRQLDRRFKVWRRRGECYADCCTDRITYFGGGSVMMWAGRIGCLGLAEKIWHIFQGRNPHTQLCCSSHKCLFLTNGAPFERELYRLSNGIRFIAKEHCYHRVIINHTQISLLFVISLFVFFFL